MTTTTSTTASTPTAPSLPTVFRRAAAAEWARLVTLRSTWWSLLAAATVMLLMGVAAGVDFAGDGEAVWTAAEFAIVPGQFGFLLVVLLAATGDDATGAIRSSLQWVPNRGVLLLARAVVPVTAMVVAAVVTAAATDLLAWALMGDAVVVVADVANSLGSIALIIAAGGLFTMGVAMIVRSTAGALTAVFLLLLVLPMMLPAFEVSWLTTLSELLPGYANVSMLSAMEVEGASAVRIAAIHTAWIGALAIASAWSFLRRDAT